jgi:hypothetical protein
MDREFGETDLQTLLRNMQPRLDDELYIFCSLSQEDAEQLIPLCEGFYREDEGITLILPKQTADQKDISYRTVFQKITLMVHSSFEAVGFIARITEVLAAQGISVNVISGYYHDHLYVKKTDAEDAIMTLELWQEKLRE